VPVSKRLPRVPRESTQTCVWDARCGTTKNGDTSERVSERDVSVPAFRPVSGWHARGGCPESGMRIIAPIAGLCAGRRRTTLQEYYGFH